MQPINLVAKQAQFGSDRDLIVNANYDDVTAVDLQQQVLFGPLTRTGDHALAPASKTVMGGQCQGHRINPKTLPKGVAQWPSSTNDSRPKVIKPNLSNRKTAAAESKATT